MPGETPAVGEGAAVSATPTSPVVVVVTPDPAPAVPVEVAQAAAATIGPTASWQEVVDASQPNTATPQEKVAAVTAAGAPNVLAEALDALVSFAEELKRLTGSLSTEHLAALDSVVHGTLDAVLSVGRGTAPVPPQAEALAMLEGTVADVTDRLAAVDSLDVLDRMRNAEERGKNRVGALSAIDARSAEIAPPHSDAPTS